MKNPPHSAPRPLRSRAWFDDPDNADMTALYLERYMNFGLTLTELQSGRPIVGIAQTGSDLSPCNRHHLVLATRLREGIRDAGGVPIEFPVHPIQETGKRPTAGLDRNLAYMGLVEVLYGYPIDGVVLTIGCDKTTPACLMAAATVDIPAIALSVGPMISAWAQGKRIGSGTVVWRARERYAAGEIDREAFIKLVAAAAPSTGYCNTMGTATTMNSLAEVLGMSLPGSAAIPAPHRDRQECAYETGRQIGDGRQSGTSGSPSILNASPEAAVGGGLAILRTGDRVRVDLRKCQVNMLVSEAELQKRYEELKAAGGYVYPQSQTPWQEMQRAATGQIESGAVLEPAVKYQRIARTKGTPRHNH